MVEFRSKLDSSKTAALNNKVMRKGVTVFIFLSAMFIVLGIIYIVLAKGDEELLIDGIVILVCGVLFTPLLLIVNKVAQKSLNKSMPILSEETDEIYTFDEHSVTIVQRKGDEYEGITRAKYSYLWKAEETPTHYFLYISKAQCHVIEKSSLTSGTLLELNSYLAQNLGAKFKTKL